MQYKCSQCGHLSSEPGNCPMCGVPMVPVAETPSSTEPTTSPESPESGPASPPGETIPPVEGPPQEKV